MIPTPSRDRLTLIVTSCSLLMTIAAGAAATDIPGGPVSGLWDAAGSPYHVLGDITVPAGLTLTIAPGVEVEFGGAYRLTAQGTLLAVGTSSDSIAIAGSGWSGIRLESPTTTSRLEFCRIGGADTGVASIDAPLEITDCLFHDHVTAVRVFGVGNPSPATVSIRSSTIQTCQQHGIFIVENSNTTVEDCEITSCALDGSPRGAIQLSNQSAGGANDPVITGNWIHHNTWQGLTAFDLTGGGHIDPLIADNTIEYNLTGIYLLYANGTLRDNQINHNFEAGNPNSGAGVMVSGAASRPVVTGNTLTGNFTAFYVIDGALPNLGDLGNANPDDDGGNRMYDNVDPGGNTWSVYSNSTADIPAENNVWDSDDPLEIAVTIFDGLDNPAYGIVDFEPILPSTSVGDGAAETDAPRTGGRAPRIAAITPDPFRARTTIRLVVDAAAAGRTDGVMRLTVHDVSGRRLRSWAVRAPIGATDHSIDWDGTDARGQALPAGIYFARLRAGREVSTHRVVRLR